MSKMLSVASGFQYSVNIGYDLNADEKLRNFIPTKSALNLLGDILQSTRPTATERSRVLIGAYGKGKSHIVLTILSLLMKKDLSLFEKLMPKVREQGTLHQALLNYYDSDEKLLPVVISGSNTSLTQAFLLALQRTLAENDLMDIMPETNYQAAIAVIDRWEKEYPEVYEQFKNALSVPIGGFINSLTDFNIEAYEMFERLYPTLTAGSTFNPFLGFDVVDLYEGVVKELRAKGYTGIYVVYDEFSKYLEANISEASVSDTKMLQDFAEKCNRSGSQQMHLMLICHKEISNYIDMLPKQKTDGWRGVSERFKHIHLNNNFSQTYEIIASVIQREKTIWNQYCHNYKGDFSSMKHRYASHALFSDLSESEMDRVIYNCYPLHPISTYILPRLSERVAQNERTLFTFMSAEGVSTLPQYLKSYRDDHFEVITPDLIFDYFEPLLKKEVYSGAIHDNYVLTSVILNQLECGSLESQIIKSLSLIYMLEQFEKLKPTKDEIVGIYSVSYPVPVIERAIDRLIEQEYVIYLKRSNDFLRLKQTSGVDIQKEIRNTLESQRGNLSVKGILNASNFDNYLYPSRYNDERDMTRYFSFVFIDEDEVAENVNWELKSENNKADGIIYGIIPRSKDNIKSLKKTLKKSSHGFERFVFVLPSTYVDIDAIVREYNAVSYLMEKAVNDRILYEEYEVILDDLHEIILQFISTYTHPEKLKATYIYNGRAWPIVRKAALTGLMSDICDHIYYQTPIINNEAINKREPTSMAVTSRNKIVAGLLRTELETNLGLAGTGQDVSIMRSTLLRTGVLVEKGNSLSINLHPDDGNMRNLLETIEAFITSVQQGERVSFANLYHQLTAPTEHIGLREGLIPIYLAAVFHEYKKQIVIFDRFAQVPLNSDVILQISCSPEAFSLSYVNWDTAKDTYIQSLEGIFRENVIDAEKANNAYAYIVHAMKRWYMALPKYTKEAKKLPDGKRIDKRYTSFLKALKQNTGAHELLFVKLPEIFGYGTEFNPGLAENIAAAKAFFDGMIDLLKKHLVNEVKDIFCLSSERTKIARMSLSSVVKDWYEELDPSIGNQLFSDGTDKLLTLFRTATNDELLLVARIAKMTTDLRIEDWDEFTIQSAICNMKNCKETAENYHTQEEVVNEKVSSGYQLTYTTDDGLTVTKRFEKTTTSGRGKLLYNSITAAIDGMGQSISEQEKRQILMEILKGMC